MNQKTNHKMGLKPFYDIRLGQIAVMGALLGAGVLMFDFSLKGQQVLLTFVFGLSCQYLWMGRTKPKSLLSALITCLSLVLLLRSNSFWAHPLTAVLSISSKFLMSLSGMVEIPRLLALFLLCCFCPMCGFPLVSGDLFF